MADFGRTISFEGMTKHERIYVKKVLKLLAMSGYVCNALVNLVVECLQVPPEQPINRVPDVPADWVDKLPRIPEWPPRPEWEPLQRVAIVEKDALVQWVNDINLVHREGTDSRDLISLSHETITRLSSVEEDVAEMLKVLGAA